MYGSRAITLLVLISDDVINRILRLDIQTNILVYVTRCCTDLTSKVLKERTFGQSSAVLKVRIYRNENYLSYRLHKPTHFGWKKCLSSTPIKNEKIFIKCAQNRRSISSMYQ